MAGSWGPSKAFLRRKKKSNRRRWAVMSKKLQETQEPVITPVTTLLEIGTKLKDEPVYPVKKCVPFLGVGVMLLTFRRVFQICWKSISQSFGLLKSVLLWWHYTKQIQTLQNQMAELQRDVGALRCALEQVHKTACHCHGTVAGSVCPMILPPPLTLGCGSSVDPPPALTPLVSAPCLPPPPPPPPLPPPVTLLQPYVPKKRVASINQQVQNKENQDTLLAVTLSDLQTVKLRKVLSNSVKSKRTPEKRGTPLITVADLQNVRLKRSHTERPLKTLKRVSVGRTPTKSPMNLRTQLKRVQINRSPGGTPLFDKENVETGTGLTPMMTQALRRKFQVALPRIPSPKAKNLNKSFDDPNRDIC
ncbi:hypothetical protein UPYG_G00123060 [Umbra pygmaea]|uniref:Proline-rich protein 11 n=1 Tax=Umbra pygmaea TaxID=75934 RepID=A0ABD0X5F9_UMBPY